MSRIGFGRNTLASLVAVALAISALAGCSKSTKPSTSGPPQGTPDDLARLVQSAILPGAVLPTNVDTTASLLFTLNVDGLRGASALFVAGTPPMLANAGAVSVSPVTGTTTLALDAYQLSVFATVQTVYTTFVTRPLGITLPFNGTSYHAFTVAGSSTIPAFADSVLSVGLPAIAAPTAGASVPRSSDLTVSWSDAGSDTTVYVMAAVTSRVDTTQAAFAALVRDADGSAIVPAAQLGTLSAGSALLSVARFRVRAFSVSARAVAIVCEAATTRSLTLN